MPASIVLFRALIWASVATGIIGSFVDTVFPSLIPESIAQAYEELPPPPMLAIIGAGLLVLVTFGGFVTATVGLYTFQPWSRKLAVVMTVLSLLAYPLLGIAVQSGWAQLLLECSSMLWGAVIVMSYVSSLSHRFEVQPTSAQ